MGTRICDNRQQKPRRGRQEAESEAAERAAQAFALSVRGRSTRAIATELGVSSTAAHGYLVAGRQRHIDLIQHDTKERLAHRHGALDAIRCEAWANYRATNDLAALELVRKCEADLRKLYGDDAPAKQQTEFSGKLESGVAFLPKEEMLAQVLAGIAKLEGKAA